MSAKQRVALVHDWLTGMRGGERVLERVARNFPGADLFTLVWHRGSVSDELERHRIHTSFLDRLPALRLRDHRGREVTRDLAVDHDKAFSLYFSDPWGHRLELTTYEHDAVRAALRS